MGNRSHPAHAVASRFVVEAVEPRRLLAGVTLITHGFQLSAGFPNWVSTMASAIAAKAGGADVYRMTITGSSVPSVSSFSKISSGPGTNAESIIEVDWGASANHLSASVSGDKVGDAIIPYLLNYPSAAHPFAELPIHLIGHSRGASVMSWLARRLGQQGVWVDQLTLLDPHPLTSGDIQGFTPVYDPAVVLDDNVVFGENIWETAQLYPHGQSVAGAINTNLTAQNVDHSGVHAYYHGTIARAASTDNDGVTISPAWYAGDSRATTGFNWSLIDDGARPAAGLSSLAGAGFGASRNHIALSTATPWPNIGSVSFIDSVSPIGVVSNNEIASIGFRYQDVDGGSAVSFYLDANQNPYDGSALMAADASVPATGTTPNTADRQVPIVWNGSALPPGIYHIYAAISSPDARTRYAYLPQALYVSASQAKLITRQFTADVGSNWTTAGNWTPGGLPGAADRLAIQLAPGTAVNITSTNVSAADVSVISAALNITGGATLTLSGGLDGGGGAVVVSAGSTLTSSFVQQASLSIAGLVTIRPQPTPVAASVSVIGQLTFTGVAPALDLGNNQLFTAAAPATIRSHLQSGQLFTSSTGGTLGYLNTGGGNVQIRFTLPGDTNLDLAVDIADLGNLASAYGTSTGAIWDQGDSDYNGAVDIADLGKLASSYGSTLAGGSAAATLPRLQVAPIAPKPQAPPAPSPSPFNSIATSVTPDLAPSRRRTLWTDADYL